MALKIVSYFESFKFQPSSFKFADVSEYSSLNIISVMLTTLDLVYKMQE